MQIVLDTNALARFFTNDIPEKAEKVEKLLEKNSLYIPDVVLPELEYVLTNHYNTSRGEIITAYRFLLAKKNIHTSPAIQKAVVLFEKTSLDMADCIIAAYSLKGSLASFDRELLRLEGIKPFWKR